MNNIILALIISLCSRPPAEMDSYGCIDELTEANPITKRELECDQAQLFGRQLKKHDAFIARLMAEEANAVAGKMKAQEDEIRAIDKQYRKSIKRCKK